MKSKQVTCHHCGGSGQINLSPDFQVTLEAVAKLKSVSPEQVAKAIRYAGATVTTINNRLTFLLKNGFVTRQKQGKTFFYSVAKELK